MDRFSRFRNHDNLCEFPQKWVVGETKHAVIDDRKEGYSFPGQLVEDFPRGEIIPRCFADFCGRNCQRHLFGGEGRNG
jgi:hypothetical protein